jgi:hypothetical protein
VADPGRPVRYELDAGGYRFVGEGTWPEHEEPETTEAKHWQDWHAEHQTMD